ncbi:hypothetical protein I7I48_02364 [Histoplasma ohiense]|nr:hypothetical protein I7I48_02364 [Histoplasma ohiense (nom. inval.)]
MTESVSSVKNEVYIFPQGEGEARRLSSQHPIIARFAGGLIQPTIPKENIKRVADVATGTGAWLIDTAKELNNPTNTYHGFDISVASFPSEIPSDTGKISFLEHNALERFPIEFHGQFDLINIRMVVQAFKSAEVPKVISNLMEILRPGGFLQWGDLLWKDTESVPPNDDLEAVMKLGRKHMKFHGVTENLPALVESTMKELGMQDVVLARKSADDAVPPLSVKEVDSACVPALLSALPKFLETHLISENEPIDSAVIEAKRVELSNRFNEAYANGYTLIWFFCVVVGRKPLE